jgi:DNA-binding winged helix-turn-helix (wHTH) protein/TolB-like protein
MKFGEFEVEPTARELRRNGERVLLQDLPFRMLLALLRRPGQVVTRDELRAELWGETHVDAEAGLNTAAAKLREALGDSAETPRFIETLPKRGYRFIGTLTDLGPAREFAGYWDPRVRWIATRRGTVGFIAVLAAGIALAAGINWSVNRSLNASIRIAVVRFHNETGRADLDRLAVSLTDAVVVSLAGKRQYGIVGNSPLLVTDRIFQDVQKIGTALKTDYVLLGQLQNGDTGLVARAHFIRVSDQAHLWAGKIDLNGVSDPERAVTMTVGDGVAAGLTKARQ